MNIAQLNQFIEQFESVSSSSTGETRKKAVDRIKTRLLKLREVLESQAKANNQLVIAVVGQMKAGKSSLLNTLLFEGVKVLPVAASPMTAGLTVIQYEKDPNEQRFEVEYYTKEEWATIKGNHNYVEESLQCIKQEDPTLDAGDRKNKFKERCEAEDKCFDTLMACYELYEKMKANPECGTKIGQPNDSVRCSALTEFEGRLNNYIGSTGDYSPVVKAVHLFINSDLLTYTNKNTGIVESYKIVDTPGINDPVESRDRVAKVFLREAHAAIMLTRADRYKTQTDISFINNHIINGGMSKVLFTINKLDLLFASEDEDRLPNKLSDAMEDYVGYVDGKYEENGELYVGFNHDVKPLLTNGEAAMCTVVCSLAEQIRLKLEKTDGDKCQIQFLDEDEKKLLKELQEWFPDDFCEDDNELASNLKLLGGFERLKDYFLLDEFLANKDSIVSQRYADQNRIFREEILRQFDTEVNEVRDNHALLDSVDLNDLEIQVKILENLKGNGLEELFNCVNAVMNRLDVFIRKTLFSEKLERYKIDLKSDATDYDNVSYTRKGTNTSVFGGKVKHENVKVNRVLPESVVLSHRQQIDKLHEQLKQLWKEKFLKERDALVRSLLECIKTIANKDTTLGIDASVYTKALESVVDSVLIGREILDVISWIDRQKIALDEYARKNDHTSLNTNYSESRMTKEEAQEKIRKQADEKVSIFKSGMRIRYIDFYDNLKKEVLKDNEELNNKLQSFVQNVSTKLETEFNRFISDKRKMIADRQMSEDEKNKFVDILNQFKDKFKQL